MSQSIAEKYPKLKFIVQDLEKQGESVQIPTHLQDRISFMTHDFFTTQPVTADAYIMRMICHDWPDDLSSQILGHLVPALQDGARIILIETIVPEPGQFPVPVMRNIRLVILVETYRLSADCNAVLLICR
jgi:hypothetical protein